jgi:hypothetical protein
MRAHSTARQSWIGRLLAATLTVVLAAAAYAQPTPMGPFGPVYQLK